VKKIKYVKMELGELDASGRRRPIPIEGSESTLEVDTVIIATGSRVNPLIQQTTPGLEIDKGGHIKVNEDQKTSLDGVYAGGDIVTGSATVIEAMGAGMRAVRAIIQKYRGTK
jgi:glutamate synthase (NADPH/NADH) small chain